MTVDARYSVDKIKNNWLTENKSKLKVCLKCRHCWLPKTQATKWCPQCKAKYDTINKFKHKKNRGGKDN